MRVPTKIPTLLGVLIIVVIISSIVVLERIFRTPSGASSSQKPNQVKITNLSDTTFTVSWTTDAPTTGVVSVATRGKPSRVYYDERDLSGTLGSYTTHFVNIRDGTPQTQYDVAILSNSALYTVKIASK